jgi:osmoprotectant transport system substrate-binding protein
MTAPSLHRSSTRLSRRSLGLGAAVAVAGLALSACGSSNALSSSSSSTSAAASGAASSGGASGSKTLTVGGANFTEMLVLQQLYGQLLAKNGYTISYKPVTDREVYGPALEQGQIDVVPDYTAGMANWINAQVNGTNAKSITTNDVTQTITAMQPLLQQKGLTALKPSAATDQNAFAVTKKFAQDNNLKTLSDLAKLGKPIKLAAPAECPKRPNCQIGLEQTYGLKIAQVLPLGFGSPQAKQAVLTGKADVVETGTTDATLDAQGLVVLQDDKNLQEAENILPVVNTQKAGSPEIAALLDKLSAALTTDDLAQLNLKVDAQRQKAEDVAKEYLTSKGLL